MAILEFMWMSGWCGWYVYAACWISLFVDVYADMIRDRPFTTGNVVIDG